jgi:type I restriction enzyme S subunit
MIEGLQPYSEYKESELPWLGRCPSHWALRRTKVLFHERVQKGFPKEPLLAATQTKGVVRKEDYETRTVTAQKDLHLLKLVETGDYVISLRSFQGGIEYAHQRGIISPAYTILKPGKSAKSGFYTHFFKAKPFVNSLSLFVTGIREGQNVDYERLSRAEMPLPPEDEQAAIVRFLDHANRKIDGFIRAKRREIALITEMLIKATEEAVQTSAAQLMRLSTAARLVYRPIDRQPSESFTRVGLYNRGRGIFHKPPVVGAELGDSDFFWIRKGDLVISGQFAWEGAVALARDNDDGCVASHRYPVLRGRDGIVSSEVLLAILRTKLGGMLLDHHSRGAAGRNRPLNINTLLKEKLKIPPISAQARIIGLLDQEYAVAQSVAKSVRLVEEYQTRLTAEVVSGKLDVRAAAAKLPDIGEEVEVELDKTDETEELGEET